MKNIFKIVIPALIMVVLVFGVIALPRIYKAPLGEPLSIIQSEQPVTAPTVVMAELINSESTVSPTPTPIGACGRNGKINLLMLGADPSLGVPPYGADAIRLVQIDFDEKKVTSLAISRDLVVSVDGEEMKIGQVFKYQCDCTQGDNQTKMKAATNRVAQLIYDNYGLLADHYFTFDRDTFIPMVDAIGGVDINNPKAFSNERGTNFETGKLHLDGKLATEYICTMGPGGDIERIVRQNVFLEGVRSKLLTFDVLKKVPDLYTQFEKTIVTDLSVEDFQQLACMINEVPSGSIQIYEMDKDLNIIDAKGLKYDYKGEFKAFLLKLFTH